MTDQDAKTISIRLMTPSTTLILFDEGGKRVLAEFTASRTYKCGDFVCMRYDKNGGMLLGRITGIGPTDSVKQRAVLRIVPGAE